MMERSQPAKTVDDAGRGKEKAPWRRLFAELPQRKLFREGLLEEMAKKDFSSEKRATIEELEWAFDDYVKDSDDTAFREIDPRTMGEMTDAIAEAAVETAYILGLSSAIPELEFYSNPEKDDEGNIVERGRHKEAEFLAGPPGKIGVNADFLKECAGRKRIEPARTAILLRKLQETVAHEMYHEYVTYRLLSSTKRTIAANWAGGEAYWKDRGENAARSFSLGYARLKRALMRKRLGLDYK
jgi:hypothetical protein